MSLLYKFTAFSVRVATNGAIK